jgi:hypothetical protein
MVHMLTRSDLMTMSCAIANSAMPVPRVHACADPDTWLAIGKQLVPSFARRPLSVPSDMTQSPARLALNAIKAGDFARALDHAEEAIKIADLVGNPATQLISRSLYGRALIEHGAFSQAAALLKDTLASAKQAGNARVIRLASLLLAECELRCGHSAAARLPDCLRQ